MSETFSHVGLGTMSHDAVARALGPSAVQTSDGYSLDEHSAWPTVVGFVHVAVPETGSATWKLDLQGAIAHVVVFQNWDLRIRYDGPLPESVLQGLRITEKEEDNEFVATLAGFVEAHVRAAMTDKWQDAEALKDDRYRSRFLALYESSLADLRGRGRLRRQRFSADVDAGFTRLTLRYLGAGTYRVELQGTASLGPVPVL